MDVATVKEQLQLELQDAIVSGFDSYTKKAFSGVVPNSSKIKDFIRMTRYYDLSQKRWTGLSKSYKSQVSLRDHITTILQAILAHFKVPNRTAISSKRRTKSLLSLESDVAIAGYGVSSLKGRSSLTLSYASCVSPICVKLESLKEWDEVWIQLAIYAHGFIYSNEINIHEHPELMIRWILGVASSNESIVGFDTTIRWKGRRRFIRTLNSEQQLVEYEIDPTIEIFHETCIAGHGTTCWPVLYDEKPWFIKEYWRPLDESRKEKFLTAARGIAGVAQLISYELGEKTTDLRWIQKTVDVQPRQLIRMTLKRYDAPIDDFRSRLQLLVALRDAVQWIFHRDISCDSILLGEEHCAVGDRGILVNFNRAIWHDKPRNLDELWPHGICPFQSFAVLRGGSSQYTFLDDLESTSFFGYV
ncbi:hypothetical protein AX16_009932 [Volvariella volvacea WC 439]|nr:hypothetical protein AX16_009932 [Volvariella volvacea WC 439]